MNYDYTKDFPTVEQLENEIKRTMRRKDYFKILRSTVSSLIVVASIAVLVSMLFLPVLRVTGTSMTPTLENGQLIMCRKNSDIKSGDVIAFYYNNKILLKRVIAVSGDTVNITQDGTVYVNDEKINEPYLQNKAFGECDIDLPYQVPDERFFVMGDNRATSIDSRSSTVGSIAEEKIIGRVVFSVWPFKSIGKIT